MRPGEGEGGRSRPAGREQEAGRSRPAGREEEAGRGGAASEAERLPAPGRPVRGSQSGRPIMALLDLLGHRWALRVIWELRGEPLAFRALQERCAGMSSSVLNQRLQELRRADIVELVPSGYRLSAEGRRLLEAYPPLNEWAERWAAREAREAQEAGRLGEAGDARE
jgi:DNA-binding HxlR family transcriptional regulator